jgi:hypothetical protein
MAGNLGLTLRDPGQTIEVRRWVVEEDSSDESSWARRLRVWARAERAPRVTRGDR